MNPELNNMSSHMLELAKHSLMHANRLANYNCYENPMWSELSVLNAAHAIEIFIKARIAEEHPLLIFTKIPKSSSMDESVLSLNHLFKAQTFQYSDLPERLWAITGIELPNLQVYEDFGKLRNQIQHFHSPTDESCSDATRKLIYRVIDPFINSCWGLFAVNFDEDEPEHLVGTLERCNIDFLKPDDWDEIHFKY